MMLLRVRRASLHANELLKLADPKSEVLVLAAREDKALIGEVPLALPVAHLLLPSHCH